MKLHRPNPNNPPPRQHQREALSWMRNKKTIPNRYGLFMEPGTGKTKTALDRMASLFKDGSIEVALVLAPNGVHRQWIEEQAPEHCPIPYRTVLWRSSRSRRWKDETLYTLKKRDHLVIVALNWEALTTKDGLNFCRWLMRNRKVGIFADESSRIRNPKAQRTKATLELSEMTDYKMIMTGTPIAKGMENLWAQMQFLDHGILDCKNYFQFRSLYCKMRPIPGVRGAVSIVGYQRVEELMARIKPHVFIRTKKECLDLPDKLPLPSPVEMTPTQEAAYEQMRDELIVQLSELERVTVAHLIAARAKLRQIAIGFIMDKERKVTPLPSLRWERTLEHLDDADGKVILWTTFRWCLMEWERLLTKHRIGHVRYQKGNNATIQEWKRDPNCKVFLGNPHSGGIGLNLAEASTMIFFNSTDDFEVRLQSEDRAHRIGQRNVLTIVDLFSPDTVETKMRKQQESKQTLLDIVMTGGWRNAL